MYNKGDQVIFNPKNPMLRWAAGMRIVKKVLEDGLVQLECGNVVLLARFGELTKI